MAANQWNPAKITGIGPIDIEQRFDCIGHTSKGHKCTNPISEACRIEALEKQRQMSAKDATSDDFEELSREITDLLTCTKNRHGQTQSASLAKEIERKIKEFGAAEFARRGGDTVMGEASDKVEDLLDQMADLQVRERRARQYEPNVHVTSEVPKMRRGERNTTL